MSTGRDRAETHWTSKQALADVYVACKDDMAVNEPGTGQERSKSIVEDVREAEAENAAHEEPVHEPLPRISFLSGYYQRKRPTQAGDSPAFEMTNVEQASESTRTRNEEDNRSSNSDGTRKSQVTTNVNPLVERIEQENTNESDSDDGSNIRDDNSDASW